MAANTWGELFRVTTFGESHGAAIGAVVDGCPPGLALSAAAIQPFLDRRRPGLNRFTTARQETDQVEILSGVFDGEGTGAPIAFIIHNTDQRSHDYDGVIDSFRPVLSDYTNDSNSDVRDCRGAGHASAL